MNNPKRFFIPIAIIASIIFFFNDDELDDFQNLPNNYKYERYFKYK